MTIQSKTHKGDGFNELRFEDEKDQEEVFIHAQKDQNNVVRNNETTQVGNDRTENVGNNEDITINNDRTEKVVRNETIHIGGVQSIRVDKNQRFDLRENRITRTAKDDVLTIGNIRKMDINGDEITATQGEFKHTTGKNSVYLTGKKEAHSAKTIVLNASEKTIVKAPGGTIIIDESSITLKGQVVVKGGLTVTGGSPEQVTHLSLSRHDASELCQDCLQKLLEDEA